MMPESFITAAFLSFYTVLSSVIILSWIVGRICRRFTHGNPHLVIGPGHHPYMYRWYLFRWHGWQLCVNKIWRSDDARALHDHHGDNWSFLLSGSYREVLSHAWEERQVIKLRRPWRLYFRRAATPHRLIVRTPVWSLWLRAPEVREWGFTLRSGCWVSHQEYRRMHGPMQ